MSENSNPVEVLARKAILAQGPISLAALMRLANTAMAESYYQNRQPFGADGDFITAPEVSQMFGEMIALALADQWQRMGCPPSVDLVELGPGRGVLMDDILRTWSKAAPALLTAANVTLVEISEPLKQAQAERLAPFSPKISWKPDLPTSSDPLLLIANEFFDALPMQQFLLCEDGWRERLIHWTEERGFHDALGPKLHALQIPEGEVWEYSAEAMAWAAEIGRRLEAVSGLALIIDYFSMPGRSTLRGIAKHNRASPLQDLGSVDLSAGVDFEALAAKAIAAGAAAHGVVSQGDYLNALGIRARHDQLRKTASPGQQLALDSALQKLTAPLEMGRNFRVLALTGPACPRPAGFDQLELEQPAC